MIESKSAPAPSAPAAAPWLPPEFRLLAYERLGSTNDEAKRLAREGAVDGTIIWAREQIAGRGRRGRPWISPPGNLAVSFILRPDCSPAVAAQLGFLAAVALGEALADLLPEGAALRYKWPNDLLLNGGKLSGILLEAETDSDGALAWIVLGIGVNLAAHPEDTAYRSTSLVEEGCRVVDAPALLQRLSRALLAWRGRWRDAGFAPVREAWLRGAAALGEAIAVQLAAERIAGRFAGIDAGGALILETATGSRRIAAGEIFPANG